MHLSARAVRLVVTVVCYLLLPVAVLFAVPLSASTVLGARAAPTAVVLPVADLCTYVLTDGEVALEFRVPLVRLFGVVHNDLLRQWHPCGHQLLWCLLLVRDHLQLVRHHGLRLLSLW